MKQIKDVKIVEELFKGALKFLEIKRDEIDNLNVFPVPDGDTGTNMHLTMMSAVQSIKDMEADNFKDFSEALSRGSLMGARGNSGVILAQIFRGFAEEISNNDYIDGKVICNAFKKASLEAYKAVKKPVKGTILTVMEGVSKGAAKAVKKSDDFLHVLDMSILAGHEELRRTPDYLPILKEAGVVDAGGYGLLVILEGMQKVALGEAIDEGSINLIHEPVVDNMIISVDDIKFTYCTEFIVMKPGVSNEEIISELDDPQRGDSLVTVVNGDIAKIHMHTNHPGELLEYAISIGEVINIKIENMRDQFLNTEKKKEKERKKKAKHKKNGFVMIVPGEGLKEIAKSIGVDVVISGGQTMNPSTHNIVEAIEDVNSSIVYVFPNNKNIILAAEQTIGIVKDKKVIVVPTVNVPEGFASMLIFDENIPMRQNMLNMKKEVSNLIVGQITYAVKDTVLGEINIKKGETLVIKGKEVQCTAKNSSDGLERFLEINFNNHDVISVYYGMDIKDNEQIRLKEILEDKYTMTDVNFFRGGQPVYDYIVSLE